MLRSFAANETHIARYLSVTRLAGLGGLFASSIRGFDSPDDPLYERREHALVNEAGLTHMEYNQHIRPWIIDEGLAYSDTDTDDKSFLVATVLTFDRLLEAVTSLFSNLPQSHYHSVELCVQAAYARCSELPRTQDEIQQILSSTYGEEAADTAIKLCDSYRLITKSGSGGQSRVIWYTESVWREINTRPQLMRKLASLRTDDRAYLELMVTRVREHQGYPEDGLRRDARENRAEWLLDFAIGVGLLSKTSVVIQEGQEYGFLTTPHFFLM